MEVGPVVLSRPAAWSRTSHNRALTVSDSNVRLGSGFRVPFVRLRAISRPIDLVLRKSAVVDVADLRNQLTMTQPYLIPVAFPARPERSALQPQVGPAVVQRLYRWRTPDQSVNIPADSDDVATLATVRTNFAGSGRSSGAGRVLHDMVAEGVACGLHRIERIMRENANVGTSAKARRATDGRWPAVRGYHQPP